MVGATAVIWQARRGAEKPPPSALAPRAACSASRAKLAAVALANKIARIAWKLMASGETYAPSLRHGSRTPDGDRQRHRSSHERQRAA